jgi:hypothetical protein
MIIYYIDGNKYISKTNIPILKISSPDEQTPAYENLELGFKFWCDKGDVYHRLTGGDIYHRLTGPAIIWNDGYQEFWLNRKKYKNIHDWLLNHPNQTNAFQVEMLLKYT